MCLCVCVCLHWCCCRVVRCCVVLCCVVLCCAFLCFAVLCWPKNAPTMLRDAQMRATLNTHPHTNCIPRPRSSLLSCPLLRCEVPGWGCTCPHTHLPHARRPRLTHIFSWAGATSAATGDWRLATSDWGPGGGTTTPRYRLDSQPLGRPGQAMADQGGPLGHPLPWPCNWHCFY